MRHSRSFAVVALALLAVTAGCSAFPGTSAPAATQPTTETPTDAAASTHPHTGTASRDVGMDSPGGRTVSIAASGRVRAPPDRAVVRVSVTARADSVSTVRERLAENASAMRSALHEAGLDDDQITTARFDIGQNYRRREDASAPKYRGEHAFALTLDDPDRAGDVVVTAVENGATQVDGVRFTLAPETRRDLRERAVADAVDNAHGRAVVAANGTGLTLDGVRTVRTASVSTSPVRAQPAAFTAQSGAAGGTSTSFEGGTVTVSARVVVVYEATKS
ncbi:MAG: SIMPL domain-containing protein [Haloplanus sp.]